MKNVKISVALSEDAEDRGDDRQRRYGDRVVSPRSEGCGKGWRG